MAANKLRVMSFNIWLSGAMVEDGITKIAKHIKLVNPDIVAMQEIDRPDILEKITRNLGGNWVAHHGTGTYLDVAILTKHKILNIGHVETIRHANANKFDQLRFNTNEMTVTRNSAISVPILLNNGLTIHAWSCHLDFHSCGPIAACNKMVTKKEQILIGEDNGTPNCRVGEIMEVFNHPTFQKSLDKADDEPVILCGDLNSPSHLDWIEENKDAHAGWAIEWPVSKILIEQAKMIDSFRKIHPDPISEPGNTFSTVQKFLGPEWNWTVPMQQNRIDYIYYKSASLEPTNSFMYAGEEEVKIMPNQAKNDYPSDHYAVVTDFNIKSNRK